MTTIDNTFNQALTQVGITGQYTQYTDPILAALKNREQEMSLSLLQTATGAGMGRDQAVRVIEGLGLPTPTQPAAAPAAAEGGAGQATIAALQAEVESLKAFARRNGFNG